VPKAIFLDRDGTIIEDKGYEHKLETLKILPGVIAGLKELSKKYLFFIITNQSGIAKGIFTVEDFHRFNQYLLDLLKVEGISIAQTYFCPHLDGCDCRKPGTKFVEQIVADYGIDLKSSWVIGDHPSDIEMGIRAGCSSAYVLTGHGQKHYAELAKQGLTPDIVVDDFAEFVGKVC
jgi:D-glycero-D-manno-heptose 1,7-bisphosphate phosphatase